MMKKSPFALPGAPRAMLIAPSVLESPVTLVGSCGIGGNARFGSPLTPPWISPNAPGSPTFIAR